MPVETYRNCLYWSLMLLIAAPVLLSGGVTLKVAPPTKSCMDVSVPRWKDPHVPSSPWLKWHDCDYEFRGIGQGVVVGLYCGRWPKEKRVDSLEKYVVSLGTKKVRRATQNEWDHADPYPTSRVGPDLLRWNTNDNQPLEFGGKKFNKTGSRWSHYMANPSLISPTGNFLAVSSWDGIVAYPQPPGIFQRDHLDGHYYVDLYNVASGQHLLTLQGKFHGVDPDSIFSTGAWISRDYYFLSLDPEHLRRFVLCDAPQVSNTANHP